MFLANYCSSVRGLFIIDHGGQCPLGCPRLGRLHFLQVGAFLCTRCSVDSSSKEAASSFCSSAVKMNVNCCLETSLSDTVGIFYLSLRSGLVKILKRCRLTHILTS